MQPREPRILRGMHLMALIDPITSNDYDDLRCAEHTDRSAGRSTAEHS